MKHWEAGHKADCKGRHWIESYFPNIRKSDEPSSELGTV